MRSNAFIGLHRAAENAGYPALLIAAMVCLGLVVALVALLALTQAGWALLLALLSIGLALAVLAGVTGAALASDHSSHTRRGMGGG
jgi:uncharacterized membrane protein